ncbi:NADP-dependent oxidoreductase [Gangjinia marincola]|uniref:NADP-dependent oxidoreductase n=1 Tax=Gangjinia marincola TaxID=578463 RepID=A0ABP3XQY7_9FLAO
MHKTQTILLKNRPDGKPTKDDFKFITEMIESPDKGQLILHTKYVSVDPYLRGRMRNQKSYIEPFALNEPITSAIIAEVGESNHKDFKKGDVVMGELAWKEHQLSNGKGLQKIPSDQAELSAYLGVLGMTGITAYVGMTNIGKPQDGETQVVSGAAGAVGSVAGQIGKIKGCHVVGIAGSDKKVQLLTQDFGMDKGINYKTTADIQKALKEACPNGVDIYYDNVGGEIADAIFPLLNHGARIINCGAIAVYNKTEMPQSISPQPFLIKNSASMQGFIVRDYKDQFSEAREALTQWLQDGKLKHKETIVEGFDTIPEAFIGLFDGDNIGKMVVKVV